MGLNPDNNKEHQTKIDKTNVQISIKGLLART